MGWNPEQYIHGNYFQNEVNETFRKTFKIQPFGNILDIGSGDGQYTHLLAHQIKHGSILGIDSSKEMVQYANQHWACNNLSFAVDNIETFQIPIKYDFILSFWCLHWTNINASFTNIFQALKPSARLYAVFSSFSENSILQTWHQLAKKNRYRELVSKYINQDSQNKNYVVRVINSLSQLPFRHVKLTIKTLNIHFPNIEYFRSLLLTMPFMKSFPTDSIDALTEDMLIEFQSICQRQHGGKLYYQTRPIFLEAIK